MALIKCPECNKRVSDTCISCVHCGYKLKLDENDYLICPKCNSKVEKSRYCSECGLDLNNPDGLSNGRRIFYYKKPELKEKKEEKKYKKELN